MCITLDISLSLETSEASTSQVTDQEDALILSPPIELEVIADVEIQSQPDVIEHGRQRKDSFIIHKNIIYYHKHTIPCHVYNCCAIIYLIFCSDCLFFFLFFKKWLACMLRFQILLIWIQVTL